MTVEDMHGPRVRVLPRAPAKQRSKKVRDYEARQKAAGMRLIRVWVRDTQDRVDAVRRRAEEVSDPRWDGE